MEVVELSEFNILLDDNRCIMHQDGDAFLENKTTGQIVKADYRDVLEQYCSKKNEGTASTTELDDRLMEKPPIVAEELLTRPNIHKWTEGQSRFVLNLYSECFVKVGPFKTFKNKKLMWAHIAEELHKEFGVKCSGLQVETRYRCVMKRTKKSYDHNNKSGVTRIESGFEEEVNRIVSMDDSIVPEYVLAVKRFTKKTDNRKLISPKTLTSSTSSSSSEVTHIIQSPPEIESLEENNIEISSDRDLSSPTPPRKRKKSVQEVIAEKYFALKQERLERLEKILHQNHQAKEESRAKRHEEKMRKLDELIAKKNL